MEGPIEIWTNGRSIAEKIGQQRDEEGERPKEGWREEIRKGLK